MRDILIGLAALTLSGVAAAQPAATPCPVMPSALPGPLAAWTVRTPLTAAARAQDLPRARLAVGRAVDLRLSDIVRTVAAPEQSRPGGNGGLVTFIVPRAGTYRLALGAPAWVDVLRDGRAVASTTHGHGPSCSSIRKIVAFRLTPGRYVVQITGNVDPTIAVLVIRD